MRKQYRIDYDDIREIVIDYIEKNYDIEKIHLISTEEEGKIERACLNILNHKLNVHEDDWYGDLYEVEVFNCGYQNPELTGNTIYCVLEELKLKNLLPYEGNINELKYIEGKCFGMDYYHVVPINEQEFEMMKRNHYKGGKTSWAYACWTDKFDNIIFSIVVRK